ncbi:retrovirus-related pol polyprotein from transposon TNT 1-94 [Tanacetum coccineum]|uniref:Retrovirus-related pol polyprotein from transposon TNT 1-94 n=1 Tax=Tanacetum coccineum TaxID=301880 RepID=A0ABQ4YBU3_9ASTR
MKAEALKKQTTASRPIKALTMYPPNTPVTLVPRALTKEIKEMKDIFEEMEAEVDQNVINRKHDEIERKNLLISNDNLIADCLSKEVFYVATNSELNVSRFTKMHDAQTIVEARCLELKAELSNLRDKVQKDDHAELVIFFSNLEVNHLNLQLKYQNLKESFGNKPSPPARDTPDFDSVFIIGKMKASIPGKDNAIKRALYFQIIQLTEKVTTLQEQNELFRAENAKVKQHYKELYDSIKITRAKHIEQTTALTTKNENLKAQIHENLKCNTIDSVKPRVLAPGRYAIDVEPIPPNIRNNREVHLDYLKHLKESVETLREIVEEAKVERPLDRSLASACLYTKHSQELLEYAIGTCPKDFNQKDKKHAYTPLNKKKQVTFEDQSPSVKNVMRNVKQVWKPKQVKQVWKATGKVLTHVGHQWRPTGRIFTLREKCPSTRLTKPKVVPATHTENQAITCANQQESNQNWGSNFPNSPSSNFVKKFIGTVRFGNDHFGAIMGYGDYVIGDSVISRVYYVEGLRHNMFFVGQFCDSDLEIAFRKHSCYVRDTDGVELIKVSRGSNLYTISVEDMMKSYLICLLSKASKNKSWLWHRRLNHLNFGTINDLARKDLVRGLPRLKFEKDHLCYACQIGKSKNHTHKPKTKNTNLEVLNNLHTDLCGPMQVQTINGKKYILVIVDDYSRFTWNLSINDLTKYYERVGIFNQKSISRTPPQNGVVERWNPTLVEAARTMLIFFKAPICLWAEAVATAYYTQNRSLIHTRHNKTPYELVQDKKPGLTFF